MMDTTTQILFETGKDAFLQGEYRQSIDYFQRTVANLPPYSRESGEVQLWLVSAYQANNQGEKAIALCRELMTHPFASTSQRAQRQLYILEAPKLERPKEWLTEIPSLDNLDPAKSLYVEGKKKVETKELAIEDFEDLSQIETQDNQFLWWALGLGLIGLTSWGIWGG
ncbi:tetratricopeptide repeat protein [Picosynechococcus sp. PCC 11901]|nr:tetratricopeptide repeat protein [Picosynechococcus sp. PCC 11901]